ncbi:MAG: FAD-linked oxidase C-terminal domain-containing protein [bacterium]|nr:FAD-linked oxidase C-terminal domain-containing protein [bacterium]
MNEKLITDLQKICGSANILSGKEDLEKYSHDEIHEKKYFPEAVVKPSSAEEISKILILANEKRFPVTPRGLGTGLTGGAVPVQGGIVLSLEKMNRILEIDSGNLMVTTEPGVITGNLHKEVQKEDLFYPVDPASLDSCSIGGNVAENAGGPRAVKYGITRDYICGLEAVLPSGVIVSLGGKLIKNVAGYDLIGLLTGSEGTLGIITKITLKLLSLPKERVALMVPFDDMEKATMCVSEIIKAKILPSAIEFVEKDGFLYSEKFLQKKFPYPKAEAYLLIELDGIKKEGLSSQYESLGNICLENGAVDVLVAESPSEQERLWEARRRLFDSLKAESAVIDIEDTVVPRIEIPKMLRKVKEISKKYKIEIVCFGHAGDGNIHLNILKKNMEDGKWNEIHPQILKEIFTNVISLGGSISGEHGIGFYKKPYLPLNIGHPVLDVLKNIKKTFDPENILNPGKIFDL